MPGARHLCVHSLSYSRASLGSGRSEEISGLLWRMILKPRSSKSQPHQFDCRWLPEALVCKKSQQRLRNTEMPLTEIFMRTPHTALFLSERRAWVEFPQPHPTSVAASLNTKVHWSYAPCMCLCFSCPRGSGLEVSGPTDVNLFHLG